MTTTTVTTAVCALGCTTRAKHTTTCPDPNTCHGCRPRPATHGTLCAWCHQRLTTDIATAPALVAHLRDIGEPVAQILPASDGKSYADPAEGSIVPAAWQAADEIHALLAHYASLVLDDHPDGHRMTGPDETGAWHTRYGAVAGVRDPRATTAVVTWLTPWVPWITEQPWAVEMRREIGELIATTSARWPTAAMVERQRTVAMPCPRCEQLSLVYAPPAVERAPFKVSCSNPDCGRIWTEDEWQWLVTMVTKGEGSAR